WEVEETLGENDFETFDPETELEYADNGKKIRYSVTTECGTITSEAVAITVKTIPSIAEISTPAAVCTGNPLVLTPPSYVHANGGTITSQGWLINGAVYTIGTAVTFEQDGATLKYFAVNECGPIASNEVIITVKAKATIGSISTPEAVCAGNALALTTPDIDENNGTIINQGWLLNNEDYEDGTAVTFAQNNATLQYFVTNECGISYSDEVTITVKDVPTVPNIATPAAVCTESTLSLTAPNFTPNGGTIGTNHGWEMETTVGGNIFETFDPETLVTFDDNDKKLRYFATNECNTTYSNNVTITVKKEPTIAEVTTPEAVCTGSTLTLTAPTLTPNGGTIGTNHGWQMETTVGGNEFAAFDPTTTVTFADSGKKLRYFATNECGISYSTPVTITVKKTPTIAEITTPDAVCTGNTLTLTAPTPEANNGTISTQGWEMETTVGGNVFADFDPETAVTFDDSGKKIRYFATNECNTTYSNTVTITVKKAPTVADITTPDAVCEGNTLALTAPIPEANNGTISAQGWQMETTVGGNVFAAFDPETAVTFADNGKKIRYFATNECNTTYSNEVTITVYQLPAKPELIDNADLTVCDGFTINEAFLLALIKPVEGVTLSFYHDSNLDDEFETITADYEDRSYPIYVLATIDATNCPASTANILNITIFVDELPTSPSAASTQTLCGVVTIADLIVSISQEDEDAGNYLTWYDDEGTIVPENTVLSNGDVYYVTQTDFVTNCESLPTEITAIVYPTGTSSNAAANNIDVCSGTSVTLRAINLGALNPTYYWYESQDAETPLFTGQNYELGTIEVDETRTSYYYLAVEGTGLCENLPGDRHEVTVIVHEQPELEIVPNTHGICVGEGSFTLTPVVTGLPTNTVQSYQWYILKDPENPLGAIFPVNSNTVYGSFPNPSGGETPVENLVRTYIPDARDAVDSIIYFGLELEGGNACGSVMDTVVLALWPLPVESELTLVDQPEGDQTLCEYFDYDLRIDAIGSGGMTNIVVTLDDFRSTGILVHKAQYYYKDLIDDSNSEWRDMTELPSSYEYFPYAIPEQDDELAGGDSLLVKFTTYAPCEFFSGAEVKFTLDASYACGSMVLKTQEAISDVLHIALPNVGEVDYEFLTSEIEAKYKGGGNFDFGYGSYYGEDRVYEITNALNKTISWTGTLFIDEEKMPNYTFDSLYFLIPTGMTLVEGSFEYTSHPISAEPFETVVSDNGIEYGIELPEGFEPGDIIKFTMDIDVSNANCGVYNTYMEIISTVKNVYCALDYEYCIAYETQAGSYFDIKIQWYEMEFVNNSPESYGTMTDTIWRGQYRVHNISAFYANDDLFIDFYIDRNNNGKIDDEEYDEGRVSYQQFKTVAGEADAYFTLDPDTIVPAVVGKQLLATHYGASCHDMVVPISTLFGPKELCAGEDAVFIAPTGMKTYVFEITSESGTTAPTRIALEGNASYNEAEDDSARYVFTEAGEYLISLYYFIPDETPVGYRVMPVRRYITVHERPEAPTLISNPDLAICEGTTIDEDFILSLLDNESYDSDAVELEIYSDSSCKTLFTDITADYDATPYHFYVIAVDKTTDCKTAASDALDILITVDPLPIAYDELTTSNIDVCDGEFIDEDFLSNLVEYEATEFTLGFYTDAACETAFTEFTTDFEVKDSHTIYITAINSATGCESASTTAATIIITVKERPATPVLFVPEASICDGKTITENLLLDLIDYDDTKVEIEFYKDAACTEDFEDIVTDYSEETFHNIYAIAKDITNPTACVTFVTAALEITVDVDELPAAPTAAAQQYVCAGATIADLDVTIVSGNTSIWYDDENNVIADPANTELFEGDVYVVTQTDVVTNCESFATTIEILFYPNATAATITADDITVCTSSSPTLEATASEVTSPVFTWFDADGDFLAYGATYPTGELNTNSTETISYFVSVKGANYCENLPDNRKEIKVTVLQQPELEITANNTGLCLGGTFILTPIVTGLEGTTIDSYQWKIKTSSGEFVKMNGVNGIVSPGANGGVTDIDNLDISYTPIRTDAINDIITLVLELETGTCGMISDTIELTLLNSDIEGELSILSQPGVNEKVKLCKEFTYELEIGAVGTGGLTKISIALDDYISTGIEAVRGTYSYVNPLGETVQNDLILESGFEYYVFSVDENDFGSIEEAVLVGGDSFKAEITVVAGCEFFSGSDIRFTLNALDACGTLSIEPVSVITNVINLDFGTETSIAEFSLESEIIAKDRGGNPVNFGFDPEDEDRSYYIDNNFNKTLTWTATFSVDVDNPDLDTDSLYFLIPAGMIFENTKGSISSTTHSGFYQNITPRIAYDDENGFEYVIPLPTGFSLGDEVTVSFDFDVADAECGDYEFYMEVISERELVCEEGEDPCPAYETRAGSYFDMTIQWYEMEFVHNSINSYGVMTDTIWRGQYYVHNISAFYNDDDLFIDFYIDRNNNGKIDSEELTEGRVAYQEFKTVAGEADAYFTLDPDTDVPAEAGYQLLATHYGSSCYDMVVPISTLFGPEELCATDTATYIAPAGMIAYSFTMATTSGTAPVRIALNENTVQYRFPTAGEFTLTMYYTMTDPDNPTGQPIRVMSVSRDITVSARPEVPSLYDDADTNVCEGETIDENFLLSLIDYDDTEVEIEFYKDADCTEAFEDIDTDYSEGTSHDIYALAVDLTSGCEALSALKITIVVDPLPVVSDELTISDTSVCDGETVDEDLLTDLITYNDTEFSLGFYTDAACETEFVAFDADVEEEDSHTIYVTAINLVTACESATALELTITVNIRPNQPELADDANTHICDGGTITTAFLTDLIEPVTDESFEFYKNAACTEAFEDIETDYAEDPSHEVYVLAKNIASGCKTDVNDVLALVITVDELPDAPIVADEADLSICDGGTIDETFLLNVIEYDDTEVEVHFYTKDALDAFIPFTSIGTNFAMNEQHTIYATAVNLATNCETLFVDALELTVNVKPIPTAPVLNPSAVLSICKDDSIDLMSLPTNKVNRIFSFYEVDESDNLTFVGDNSVNATIMVSPSETTNYRVFVSTNGCLNNTGLDFTITVKDIPTIASISVPAAVCAGNPLSLTTPTVSVNGGTISNQGWLLNDEIYINANVTYAQNGQTLKYFAV
ncbi:hypothetical protein LJC25_04270, partial [Bacteroidales bacterium OttesenSCG-928-K03]|nr:hypothetical protein [Bacteroidales bacterium OttesenSCG-928-K03]